MEVRTFCIFGGLKIGWSGFEPPPPVSLGFGCDGGFLSAATPYSSVSEGGLLSSWNA
jgi:hypothetical protein